MRFLSWLLSTAIALAVAAWLFDGIWFAPRHGALADKVVPLLVVALILGVVSAFVKPVLQILSIPFIILTLGLFLLVINAAMLMPVLLLFLAFTVDIGNWWVHKRHLQLQVDAAALAGGGLFGECFTDPAGANVAIQNEAARFGGAGGSIVITLVDWGVDRLIGADRDH